MQDKFKVSIYIRVSTGRQANEGDSLEEQEKELKKFCEYKNYLIHKVHIERGRSAKNTNRPEYQKLVESIKDKKINAVVVKKLDRLSRSLLDFEEFMKIAQANEVEFISLKENFDTTNAMGKAMLRVALVFAQLEREQTSERVTDVMSFRAEQGFYNGGHLSFGYDLINAELVPHKKERKVIEIVFNRFLETQSTSQVAHELNAEGQKTRKDHLWTAAKIDYVLRNPLYIGKIKWNKKSYPGIHQPLITEETFNRVQNIFSKRRFFRHGQKVVGLLKHLLICGHCQSFMLPNYTRKKNKKLYFYYRCASTTKTTLNKNCQNKYLQMDEINQKVISKILELADETKLKMIEQSIKKENLLISKQIDILKTEIESHENQLKVIQTKKEKYLDSLISNPFSEKERQTINSKIDDFSLEEKKIKATIYKCQLSVDQEQNKIQKTDVFKKELIDLKINHKQWDFKKLQTWFQRNVRQITANSFDLIIEFKLIKLTV